MKPQPQQPVFINFFFHFEDFINRGLSQPAIRRLVDIFIRNRTKCDIYYTASLLDFLARENPETLALLRKLHITEGYGLGYHGDIHGPNPTPYIYLNAQKPGLDEGIDWCIQRETHRLDPLSGELNANQEGGLLLHDRLLGVQSLIGVATNIGPQWILALRRLGIKMQLGGEWSFKGDSEAFAVKMDGTPLTWWMGSLVLADLHPMWVISDTSYFDKLLAQLDRSHPNLIIIVGHDCDMYQNALWAVHAFGGRNLGDPQGKIPASFEAAQLPPEKIRSDEQQEATYQKVEGMLQHVFSIVARDPSLRIVTCNDLYKLAEPPVLPSYSSSLVYEMAQSLARPENWQHDSGARPPNFIRLRNAKGGYLTLAETFGLLCTALAYFQETGKFPAEIPGRELLGPAELAGDFDPISSLHGEVPAQLVLATARELFARLVDRVPMKIDLVSTSQQVNAAEFLFMMAWLVIQLMEGSESANLSVPLFNSHLLTPLTIEIMEAAEKKMLVFPFPEGFTKEMLTGRLSLQQMWALKPAQIRENHQ